MSKVFHVSNINESFNQTIRFASTKNLIFSIVSMLLYSNTPIVPKFDKNSTNNVDAVVIPNILPSRHYIYIYKLY